MCGIVGYVGDQSALEVVIEGLRRLEYRGYDSAGVALLADGKIAAQKRAGKLANLEAALAESPLPAATTGIGHTRWATHGAPNDRNAHPHLDCTGSVAVIHNGIIENYSALRAELEERGHQLASDTDTETVAHLLEEATRNGRRRRRRRPRRGDAPGLPAAGGRVHPGGDARRRPGCRGRRPPQLPAGRRTRGRRELPRVRRRRLHRAHPGRGRARPGPGRRGPQGRDHGHRLRRSAG